MNLTRFIRFHLFAFYRRKVTKANLRSQAYKMHLFYYISQTKMSRVPNTVIITNPKPYTMFE